MFDINFEFTKGVLFVRIEGRINSISSVSIEKSIIDIIIEGGIKYLVLNINNLIMDGDISLFDNCYKYIKKNKGKMFICGLKDNLDKKIGSNYKYCGKINNELTVLRLLNVC